MSSKTLSKEDVIQNKKGAIKKVNALLESYINHPASSDEYLKKANLISYWLKSYSNMISFESKFDPSKNISYKRGNVIKVDFGFNIGSEQGGRHYSVVVEKNNPHNSPVITVIPLSSMKENKHLHKSEVFLGDELYRLMKIKHSTIEREILKDEADNYMISDLVDSIEHTSLEKIKTIEDNSNGHLVFSRDRFEAGIARLKTILQNQRDATESKKTVLKSVAEEISRMKEGSYAIVNQITTISKIRILDPKATGDVLNGITLSSTSMELINECLKNHLIF